ncbi:helix-turn-helix domain-containing protein [Streptomyces sp. ET3-23]|uniref:helix-turn-helix domain-containing protein n=1 Tax=Streptomyces sp. ET3-23 TaxID=2885643 RepID=UPI001D105337|nr:helix-turn-helix transcriptional regulator [Streptomyces sp. ET3-23]MCC2275444.1 helix-turn-helix domain-containing protein [Streptomyces sp. ET3-23]
MGAQLRRWREAVEMPSGDIARAMGWSQARFSRVERGYYRITREEVYSLCAKLGVDDPDGVEEVARVAEEPTGTGWWAPYAGRIGQNYMDFIELEAEAETIRVQHPVIIPGPLQSPGYVREMIARAPTAVSAERAELLVSIRMARQEILARTEKPVKVHALVPESSFHAQFESGPAIMRDQLRRLLDVSDMPNVTVQIVPLTAHPTYGANGAMTLLTFRQPWTMVASIDNPMGGTHTEDPDQVEFLEREFDGIASIALPVDESRDLVSKYLEGLHK